MITCKYCGVSYKTFESLCDHCGAPMSIAGVTAVSQTETASPIAKIRQICVAYVDAEPFYADDAIPPRILHTALKSFTVFPQTEDILLFCDTTPMGSGVWGFVISQEGLYWKNNVDVATTCTYLSWADFAQRKIKRQKYTLDLGQGDVINIAGLGSAAYRTKAERLLKEIRTVFNQE